MYGIVKQNKGFIWVYSEVGTGTVFKIYLPCVCANDRPEESTLAAPLKAIRGSETLLVVEDEEAVRQATAEFLRLQGYTVLEAANGTEGLMKAQQWSSTIHLLVTDVVMPNMSGGELAEKFKAIRTDTRVLFLSGYAGKTILDHNVVDLETNFLQKPYSLKQLSLKIREALRSSPTIGDLQPLGQSAP